MTTIDEHPDVLSGMSAQIKNTPWHVHPPVTVLDLLRVDRNLGLTAVEARARQRIFGKNQIRDAPSRSLVMIFIDQFRETTVGILMVAAAIAGWIGEVQDIWAILAIITLNSIMGFVQEFRAQRSVEALRKLAISQAMVLRDGRFALIQTPDLVPGDIVRIEAGNRIPADIRLLDVSRLKVDESALTGESLTIEKSTQALLESHLILGDRLNMAYSGTLVSFGHAEGIVVATGMDTELGRIATLLHEAPEASSPLEKRLSRFGKRLSIGILLLCGIFFLVGVARHEQPLPMLLVSVSLAVAAIPEALPAVIKVSLSLGARIMVQKNVLVRRLSSVESLGSTTTICTDKTGTLTENRMTVTRAEIFQENEMRRSLFFRTASQNNDVLRSPKGILQGDPTETALVAFAEEKGFSKDVLDAAYPRQNEIPFSAERGMMTTVHGNLGSRILLAKGSPERILEQCRFSPEDPTTHPRVLLDEASQWADDGLRVLAFAYTDDPETISTILANGSEQDLTFLGFVGLMDPIRPEVPEAVRSCHSAGIRVVMLTGDHPATACSIAKKLGILDSGMDSLTGRELEEISPEEYAGRVRKIRVYSRLDPSQKVRIVQTLQRQNEVVAMTGDGINDAPALKSADIGIAMGRGGTDVAREAAPMILLDDNFASIVLAVREGRRILDNLLKFIKYVLTGNAGEIWTLLLAPLFGLPLPLLPIQILWVNLVTDGLPGIALAAEPAEEDLMRRSPRPMNADIFSLEMTIHIFLIGILIGSVTLLAQFLALLAGSPHWRSIAFTVLTLSQMAAILGIRVEGRSVIGQPFLGNPWVLGAVLLTVFLQWLVLAVPLFQRLMGTQPLTIREWIFAALLSSVVLMGVEIEKWFFRLRK